MAIVLLLPQNIDSSNTLVPYYFECLNGKKVDPVKQDGLDKHFSGPIRVQQDNGLLILKNKSNDESQNI